MAQQTINVGTAPNDGTGTPLRTAFQYTNSNFSELYTAVGPSGNNIVVPGSATITGDLTVDTSTLKVDSANDRVGIGTATPSVALDVVGASAISGTVSVGTTTPLATGSGRGNVTVNGSTDAILAFGIAGVNSGFVLQDSAGMTLLSSGATYLRCYTNGSERYKIDSTGVATWSNVGGVAGTAMTLNSTGLGIGAAPEGRLNVANTAAPVIFSMTLVGAQRWQQIIDTTAGNWTLRDQSSSIDALIVKAGSGNLGVGVTPSAWASGNKFIDINSSAAFGAFGSSDAMMIGNAYWNGSSWIRKTANNAWRFVIESVSSTPTMTWQLAANGSAGSSITWTQAMTLTADGELLVGTASVGGVFDTKFYLSSNSGTNKWAVGPYGTATNFAIIPTPGTGGVYLSGTSATSWTAYSDERLKDIIEPITNALTKVGSLRSVIGKFKGDEANTRRPFLIAQDLQSALPEAVDASNPDRLGVAYTDVIPLLVAAIKELTAEVNALKNA